MGAGEQDIVRISSVRSSFPFFLSIFVSWPPGASLVSGSLPRPPRPPVSLCPSDLGLIFRAPSPVPMLEPSRTPPTARSTTSTFARSVTSITARPPSLPPSLRCSPTPVWPSSAITSPSTRLRKKFAGVSPLMLLTSSTRPIRGTTVTSTTLVTLSSSDYWYLTDRRRHPCGGLLYRPHAPDP